MGNTVDKMRQRELSRREMKREELLAFLEGSKRRQSLLEINGNLAHDDVPNLHFDGDRQAGIDRSQFPGGGALEDGDHRLTDREREAWLYRMENEALDVMNDNMELQEERRRERERREERREELENMGLDGGGGGAADPDQGDDPNALREDDQAEERTPVSSRRSSLVATDDDFGSDIDDLVDDELGDADDAEVENDGEAGDDAASEGAPESERGEAEPVAAEEAGGGDDEEHRREH